MLTLFLLARFLLRALAPSVVRTYRHGVTWLMAHRTGVLARLGRAYDPDSPHVSAMVLSSLLLLAAMLGLVALLQEGIGQPFAGLDEAVSGLAESIRLAWGDAVMVFLTAFGDPLVLAVVAAVALAYLAAVRAWELAAALVVAGVAAELFVHLVRAVLGTPPLPGEGLFSFLSGHVTLAVVLLGLFASLALKGLPARWTALGLTVAFAVGGMIALARVFLEVHWASDVLAGLLFAAVVVAAFNLWLVGNPLRQIEPAWFGAVLMVVFLSFGTWHASSTFGPNRALYGGAAIIQVMPFDAWLDGGWQPVPRRRIDFGGELEEPLPIQWAGPPTALEETLRKDGLTPVRPWSLDAGLRLFGPTLTPLAELPAVPLMHEGRLPLLMLARPTEDPAVRLILRLWPSDLDVVSGQGRERLYLGSIAAQGPERRWGFVTLLREAPPLPTVIGELRTLLERHQAVLTLRQFQGAPTVLAYARDGV